MKNTAHYGELLSYEEMTSFRCLYLAHKKARASKQHKKDVIDFENNLSYNLIMLEKELKEGTYKISGYNKFYIYEPKEREIQALSYRDRIVQHTICDNYLTPFYKNRLIFANSACQLNKGTHFARNLLKRYLRKYYNENKTQGYFLKCDIKKYFANIDHDIIKDKINRLPDKHIVRTLSLIHI